MRNIFPAAIITISGDSDKERKENTIQKTFEVFRKLRFACVNDLTSVFIPNELEVEFVIPFIRPDSLSEHYWDVPGKTLWEALDEVSKETGVKITHRFTDATCFYAVEINGDLPKQEDHFNTMPEALNRVKTLVEDFDNDDDTILISYTIKVIVATKDVVNHGIEFFVKADGHDWCKTGSKELVLGAAADIFCLMHHFDK